MLAGPLDYTRVLGLTRFDDGLPRPRGFDGILRVRNSLLKY